MGQGRANDQRDDRMPRHAGRRVSVMPPRRAYCQVNSQQGLDPPVGLALDVDDGNDWPLGAGTIGGDCLTHMRGRGSVHPSSETEARRAALGESDSAGPAQSRPAGLARLRWLHRRRRRFRAGCSRAVLCRPMPGTRSVRGSTAMLWRLIAFLPSARSGRSPGPSGGAAGSIVARRRLYSSTFSLRCRAGRPRAARVWRVCRSTLASSSISASAKPVS